MVRLNKSIIRGKIKPTQKQQSDKKPGVEVVNNEKESKLVSKIDDNDVEILSGEVISTLKKDGVLPTPVNYAIYFDKLLEQKPLAVRKKINEVLEPENSNQDERRSLLEKEIKESFAYIKAIFSTVQSVYKNIKYMKDITSKKYNQIKNAPDSSSSLAYVEDFAKNLQKLNTILDKQVDSIKRQYEKTSEVLKRIEQNAIFDTTYGVYNRKYLLDQLKAEQKNIKAFGHKSSLLTLRIKEDLINSLPSQKEKLMLTRIVAKLLLKSSRRSDIVTHYGNGIFILLLKHTNTDNAQKAAERILNMISTTSFFLSSQEIDIDVEIAIVSIKDDAMAEELISCMLDELPKTGKDLEPYTVCEFEA